MLTSVIDIRSVKNDDYEDADLDDEYDESLYEQYLQGGSRLSKREAYNYETCMEQYVEDGDESCLCDLLQGELYFSTVVGPNNEPVHFRNFNINNELSQSSIFQYFFPKATDWRSCHSLLN